MSVVPHSPIADRSSLSHRQPSGSFLTLPPPAIRAWSRGTKKGKIMAGVSMEKFEEYFQKADVDRDGRISGAEAVAFLQVSNLHRQVLAQIWMHADQNRIGFLSRPEFYNALGLVTVSQSKRELKPDIVKAALYGHASAAPPPPSQINVSATPGPQQSPVAASPLTQVGATSQPSSQNPEGRLLLVQASTSNLEQCCQLQACINSFNQCLPLLA